MSLLIAVSPEPSLVLFTFVVAAKNRYLNSYYLPAHPFQFLEKNRNIHIYGGVHFAHAQGLHVFVTLLLHAGGSQPLAG